MRRTKFVFMSLIIISSMFTSCMKPKVLLDDSIKKQIDIPTTANVKLEQIKTKTEAERYKEALDAVKVKRYPHAMGILSELGDYKDSKNLLDRLRYLINGSYIGNGIWAVGALTLNGRVEVAYYDNKVKNERYNVDTWKDIKAISFRGGDSIEGLTAEGKIITTSTVTKEELLKSTNASANAMANVVESVSLWKNIKAFQTHYPQTAVALTSDGLIYAAYPFHQDGTVKLEGFSDIAAVADGRSYVAGLKKDGTVISKVYDYIGEIDTSNWKDIVSISASSSLIGLKEDGTVIATGLNRSGEGLVSDWKDIIAISTSQYCTLGLKRDGTVVAAGQNIYGQMEVKDWTDIVAIAAGHYFSIGLKADGTMVLSGDCQASGAKTPDVSKMKGLYVPEIKISD